MAEDKPKAPAKSAPTKGPRPSGESVAEAPGPITPEHESGSWEQTLAEREGKSE